MCSKQQCNQTAGACRELGNVWHGVTLQGGFLVRRTSFTLFLGNQPVREVCEMWETWEVISLSFKISV
jgi:hypothetical protein